jgi:CHAD domain-containing protein
MSQTRSDADTLSSAEAPAPPAPLAPLLHAARRRYQETLELLTAGHCPGQAGLADADFVHDLRVASRRLTEVARLLQSFLDKPTHKAVAASLKGLRRAVGDLRDLDVAREHLLKWRMPAPVKAPARSLADQLARRRPMLEEAGRVHMASASVSGTLVVLARVLEDLEQPGKSAAAEQSLVQSARALDGKRRRQLRRAFGQAAKKQTPEALHAARIAVKKLRYILELQQETKRGLKRRIYELKRFQELLGTHHDVHVILTALADHLKRNPAPEPRRRRLLRAAWSRWRRRMQRGQAKRTVAFLLRSHSWLNR